MGKRMVVEVDADLHHELRKLAAVYDSRIYIVAGLLLMDCLSDSDRVAAVLATLDSSSSVA